MDFSGQTAVVTGASGGLGREIAVALGTAGARVGLVAKSREGLEETRRRIGQSGARVFCTPRPGLLRPLKTGPKTPRGRQPRMLMFNGS